MHKYKHSKQRERERVYVSHRANSAQKPAVAEEDNQERYREMENEHVDYKRCVVIFRLWGVVIYPA